MMTNISIIKKITSFKHYYFILIAIILFVNLRLILKLFMESIQIGSKIKKLRELKNYTQQYMAEQLNLTQSGYSKIETGEIDLTFSKLSDISKILQVNTIDIIGFDERKFFNNNNNNDNVNGNANGIIIQDISAKVEKLYEDKIALLNEIIRAKDELIKKHKD